MKKLTIIFLILLFLLPLAVSAAECTLNGKSIPCSEIPTWVWILPIVFIIIFIAGLTFWIWMLVDCIRFEEKNRIAWIVVLFLLGILGAIIYFFAGKRKRKSKNL